MHRSVSAPSSLVCLQMPPPHAGIHQRDAKLMDHIDVKSKIINSWKKVLMYTVVQITQIYFQIHPCMIRMHRILHHAFMDVLLANINKYLRFIFSLLNISIGAFLHSRTAFLLESCLVSFWKLKMETGLKKKAENFCLIQLQFSFHYNLPSWLNDKFQRRVSL